MRGHPLLTGIRVSLTEHIWKYKCKNGEAPESILAETDAFLLLQNDVDTMVSSNGTTRWRGILLKRIAARGVGIYLCGKPIPVCEARDSGDRIYWPEDSV